MENEEPMLTNSTIPDHKVKFHGEGGDVVGNLDFNGSQLVFTGDADASAKVFIELIDLYFGARLKQERERCAKVCESEGARIDASWSSCAAAIRELK